MDINRQQPLVVHMKELPKFSEEVPVFVSDEELNSSGITSEDLSILGVGAAGMSIIVLAGGAIATTALLVSIMTIGSGVILWIKMPGEIGNVPLVSSLIKWLPMSTKTKCKLLAWNWKDAAERYEIVIDLFVSGGVLLLYGSSVTGLVAAGISGLAVSAIMRGKKIFKKLTNTAKVAYNSSMDLAI